MYQSCKESAQYTCRAKYICNYNSQIKLTQVSNYYFHVFTIFRLTFYKILLLSIYLYDTI